jgi:regulator of sirC expression with transglutaminase-like and TPR domain
VPKVFPKVFSFKKLTIVPDIVNVCFTASSYFPGPAFVPERLGMVGLVEYISMLRLSLVPWRPSRYGGRPSAGRREWAGAGRRGLAFRLFEAILFVATLLLAWLLSVKVAGGAPSTAADPSPLEQAGEMLYRDLGSALGERWRARPQSTERAAAADPSWVRVRLYDLAMAASAATGGSEDPRRRLEALTNVLGGERGFRVPAPPAAGYGPEHLLPDEVLARREGSPLGLLLVYLSVGEILSPPLDLEPVVLPGAAALRFRDGNSLLNLLVAPGQAGTLLREDGFPFRFEGGGSAGEDGGQPKELTKKELTGILLAELARAARSRGEADASRSLLGEAVKLAPRCAPLWIDLAEAAGIQGDSTAEARALEEALVLDPKSPRAHLRRGALLRRSGDLQGAERDFLLALEAAGGTGDPAVLLELGDLERERGKPDRALDAYRRYLVERPTSPERERVQVAIREIELEPSLEALKAKGDYPAKFGALRRVAESPTRLSTGVLIQALRDENLRFSRLVWRELRKTTGQDLGFEPEAWERWWRSQGNDPLFASNGS